MPRDLIADLDRSGYQARLASVNHLRDLEDDIESQHKRGHLSEGVYDLVRSSLAFRIPDEMRYARSLIMVACPQPQVEIDFTYRGRSRGVLVPPTYLYYKESDEKVARVLRAILEPEGYHIARARIPEKLLAVRSGLGLYGKNNICYVQGMGSFHRLIAYYSDFPCHEDTWRDPTAADSCEDCTVCLTACPCGAITRERFLIRAERCLTFLNENPGDFPDWIDPSWHHCAVGCLFCQTVCPQNREFMRCIKAAQEFSEEETGLILDGVTVAELPGPTVAKLEQLDLIEYLPILPRNLCMFFERRGNSRFKT